MIRRLLSFFILCALSLSFSVEAAPLRVAVAANFKPVLDELAQRFEKKTGNSLTVSSASTGVLYNQIINGAPFDVFLSADSERPKLLEDRGLVTPGSRALYAKGILVLWNTSDQPVTLDELKQYDGRIAIANPATAPYGLAAEQALKNMGAWENAQKRLVTGNSIQQTWQFVASGNIQLGLVARAQLVDSQYKNARIIKIPQNLYDPIRQELVILKRSQKPEVAQAFVDFILSEKNQNYIGSRGYRTDLSQKNF